MGMKEVLEKYDFSEKEIEEVLSGMEESLGRLSSRTGSENLIENQVTGRIMVIKHAEPSYRLLFAKAGMNMNDYLSTKTTFFKGFRTANSLSFEKLTSQDGLELPFLKGVP